MTTIEDANKRSYKCIEGLTEDFAKMVRGWCVELTNSNIQALIYCGFRSFEEQTALYAKGRTERGKIVTKARAGQSFHNYGMAIDWVPLKKSDKNPELYVADWENDTAYCIGEQIAPTFNMRGISWESGHLEDARYKDWRELERTFGYKPRDD